MKRNLALLASAAMLAGVLAANAQQTTPSPGGSTANQCWDMATNSIKNQAPGSMASGSSSSGTSSSGTVGSASPSGSAGSASGSASSAPSSSSSSGTSAATRPPGMLNC